MKKRSDHTFIICAYKEQPYLEECVKSLLNQTCKSEVMISTSTPNDFIKKIAKKYHVKLLINTKTTGHINDFIFAYEQANTKYVTLCHQDDIYLENFGEETIKKMEKSQKPIIAFTNYYEKRDEKIQKRSLLLLVKRIINFPLLLFKKSKKVRLFTLSLGNAICAPAVTYNKEVLETPLIQSDFKSNVDWLTYLDFAKRDGEFVYIKKPLMLHRIHEGSTTSSVIEDNTKAKEDYQMFRKFWPDPIAKLLLKIYGNSEKSNNLKKKGEKKNMKYIMVLIYLILTIAGLILYKKGTNEDFLINFTNHSLNVKLSLTSIIGLVCYLCSFFMYMLILPKFDLTYIMPLMSAVSSISIYLLSIFILKETVTVMGIVGSIIILIGIFIVNIGGK